MADSTITFIVLGAVVVAFVSNVLPVPIVAVGTALTLWATGVLELEQALAGFGDPAVVFIAALFVVSEGLDATGVTTFVGQRLVSAAGTSRRRIVVLMMLVCATLTAVISVNGAVAALLPVVVVMAMRLRQPSSQLMMPLAFAAHAGSMLALTGTPVSIVVSEAADGAGYGEFGFFEFALAGIPLLVGTIVIVAFLGNRLLPHRNAEVMPRDFSDHTRRLADQYRLDHSEDELVSRGEGVAELVVPPRSELIGQRAFPGMVSDDGTLVVLAVQRRGEDLGRKDTLGAGDVLLVRGAWSDLVARGRADDVLLVDAPDALRRQLVPLGAGAKRTLVIVGAMVVLLATGAVPPAVAGLLAAGALVLTRVMTMEEAYGSIGWTTVVLVAGMLPLSTAMTQSGAAEKLANGLVDLVGDSSDLLLLIGLFLLTVVLGQLISNMATALIVIPIALSAAAESGVSAQPLLMAVNVAAAAALLTPVATPANMMVMAPGAYRFGDYAKLGLPILVWYFVIAAVVVPLVWSF